MCKYNIYMAYSFITFDCSIRNAVFNYFSNSASSAASATLNLNNS